MAQPDYNNPPVATVFNGDHEMPTKTLTKPKLGDVIYVVTWIDRDLLRKTNEEDDLAERLLKAERARRFDSEQSAKAWAVRVAADRDEYGNPRCEKRTLQQDDEDMPPEWVLSEYQEWSDDASWQPLTTV